MQSTISEETFQTLLVSKALEKLGYDVKEPREVDYNVAYTSIASGDATFIAVNWDPLHADQAAGGAPSSTAKASTSTAPRRAT